MFCITNHLLHHVFDIHYITMSWRCGFSVTQYITQQQGMCWHCLHCVTSHVSESYHNKDCSIIDFWVLAKHFCRKKSCVRSWRLPPTPVPRTTGCMSATWPTMPRSGPLVNQQSIALKSKYMCIKIYRYRLYMQTRNFYIFMTFHVLSSYMNIWLYLDMHIYYNGRDLYTHIDKHICVVRYLRLETIYDTYTHRVVIFTWIDMHSSSHS